MRNVITDEVYRRPKHAFLSPLAALNPKGRLSALMQDMLRGPVLASMPFFDERKVIGLLDRLYAMDEGLGVGTTEC